MMFTILSAKLAGTKAKVLAATAVAGAALMLAAPAAQAQRLAFGVTVGGPVYAAPAPAVVYAGPGYYDGVYFRDYNGWRAHEMMLREHRFSRDHDYYHHDDRRFDRGHDGHFDRR
jgi:hypothetical protein